MKADCKIFKGIEYVQFNELPVVQQETLLQTINQNLFIKIMIDGQIISQCLQFKDYNNWYESVYKVKTAVLKEAAVKESLALEIKPNLALNKL